MPECSYRNVSQYGFTLLELLVVITLLAIVAGIAMTGYDNFQQQARYDATRYEMTQIRQALLQFRRDSGTNDFPGQGSYDCTDEAHGGNTTDVNRDMYFPAQAGTTDENKIDWCQHPANFWMLFRNPFDNPATTVNEGDWNIDTKRGWNGPYLNRKNGYLTINASSDFDNVSLVYAIQDPFTFKKPSATDKGFYWFDTPDDLDLTIAPVRAGSPYLFMLDTATDPNVDTPYHQLINLYANRSYDDPNFANCNPGGSDDLILCLLR